MRTFLLAILGVTSGAGAARAAEAPLLVSVEIAPGIDVHPADVRRAIALELGTSVIGAQEPSAADASDVLLVTVEPHEVRMSLRTGAAPIVSRTISAPSDRSGRLRSIGWLAGNLVRDQVGPVVTLPPSPSAIADTRPPTEPPALADGPPPGPTSPVEVVGVRSHSGVETAAHMRWAITASGGPTLTPGYASADADPLRPSIWVRGTAYDVEVQRQASRDSMQFGVSLQVGPRPVHYIGGLAFVGSGWQWRLGFLEANLGLGLEAREQMIVRTVVTESSTALGSTSETTVSQEPLPGLYARGQAAAGIHLTPEFDLVAQLGVQAEEINAWFVSSKIGVRLRLP